MIVWQFVNELVTNPVIAGLAGVMIGSWLTYRFARRTAFDIERQRAEVDDLTSELALVSEIISKMRKIDSGISYAPTFGFTYCSSSGDDGQLINRLGPSPARTASEELIELLHVAARRSNEPLRNNALHLPPALRQAFDIPAQAAAESGQFPMGEVKDSEKSAQAFDEIKGFLLTMTIALHEYEQELLAQKQQVTGRRPREADPTNN